MAHLQHDGKTNETRFAATIFPNLQARICEVWSGSHVDLRGYAAGIVGSGKASLPLISPAQFGSVPTAEGGCLRHDGNVLSVTGAAIDYDGETVPFADAVAKLRAAGVACFAYTSPSYTTEKPRWRVVALATAELARAEHGRMVARLNGVLGGIASPESFKLSQSFYIGRVAGVDYHAQVLDGRPVNECPDLDAGAIGCAKPLVARSADRTPVIDTEACEQTIREECRHYIDRAADANPDPADPDNGDAKTIAAAYEFWHKGASGPLLRAMLAEFNEKRAGGYYDADGIERKAASAEANAPHACGAHSAVVTFAGLDGLPDLIAGAQPNGTVLEWPRMLGKEPAARDYQNARAAVRHLGIVCRFDEFRNRMIVGGHEIAEGEFTDRALSMLRQLIVGKLGYDTGTEALDKAVAQLCYENAFDPVRDYLDGLTWDGVPRLDAWLATYLGAEPTALNAAIGRAVLTGAVRRVRQPGSKFDAITVLEGPQGTGKSTAIAALAGQGFFSDQDILHADGKEQMEQLDGIWLYEIAELAGMSKVGAEKLKAFASRQVDRGREAYARRATARPRRCVFFGTTNDTTYLRDPTGNRRFWPVATANIDAEALGRDRDQLWAEAAAAEAALPPGQVVNIPPDVWTAAAAETASREALDPWLDILAGVSPGETLAGEDRVSTEALRRLLDIPAERLDVTTGKRIATCMRKLGWTSRPDRFRINGALCRGFVRPAVASETIPPQAPAELFPTLPH